MPDQDNRERLALYRLMALLATFTTATDLRQSILERRAGHDPSEQEEQAKTRRRLTQVLHDMKDVLAPFQASLVQKLQEDPTGVTTHFRDFTHLIQLRRLNRLLKRSQQYMLSLYPAVSEEDVEACRILGQEAEEQMDRPMSNTSVFLDFVERCFVFINRFEAHYLK